MKRQLLSCRVRLALTALFVASTLQAQDFWLGADISGTTALEARGDTLFSTDGVPTENTLLMKQYGMNAIRLRVWVDPKGGFCNKEDVCKMALRAKALDLEVMIDFHYSDWWADPSHQNPPAAWKDYDFEQMKQAVAKHTEETLSLLKQNDIDIKWVQVGNETTDGFIWDMGKASLHMDLYTGLTNAGYDAVKRVYPNAIAIVHIDCGDDQKRYDWLLDGMKKYDGKWDMIGMSLYPYWSLDENKDTTRTETDVLNDCLANIKHVVKKYGCDVMIVETGYEVKRPEAGKIFMKQVIDTMRQQTDNRCKGVFYWAPELEGEYPLGAFQNHRPTVIMDAFREAAKE